MLDKEGASTASDIALVGSESEIVDGLGELAAAGATDFVASIIGDAGERDRSFGLLSELARA